MGYRRRTLTHDAPAYPSPTMPALRPVEPVGPHNVQHAMDTLTSSCRVLAELGLQGSAAFTVPADDDPDYKPGSRLYPDVDTPRVALRLVSVQLTPGHVLALHVIALPSGPTQVEPTNNKYEEDGRGGTVTMAVTYRNGDPVEVDATASVTPSASVALYGAEPASAHDSLEILEDTAIPWQPLPSASELEQWMRGDLEADITITYEGSPRPIDIAVVEIPASLVVDTDSTYWPGNIYTQGGQPYTEIPSDYPITQLTSTDPGGGLEALRRAVAAHGARLGPCLAWWSSAREAEATINDWIAYDSGTGDDEAPPVTTSSTTYVNLPFTPVDLSVADDLPGFLLGGYARLSSGSDEFLDGRTGVLPVWLVAYGSADAGELQFRSGSSAWSTIDASFADGIYEWQIVPGWIEVGVGPEDGPVGRFWVRETGGDPFDMRYAAVFYRQDS